MITTAFSVADIGRLVQEDYLTSVRAQLSQPLLFATLMPAGPPRETQWWEQEAAYVDPTEDWYDD